MNDTMYNVIGAVVLILIFAYGVTSKNIKNWLRYGVFIAEEDLGSGTGQLKLVKVYNLFVECYPIVSKILPFSIFSKWVDLALAWLKVQLESNPNVKQRITG